ncbi:C6 transcription factor [Fusarium napiforme]|uniref:C6 transcription factor n=1 Tax=Fusarium napiforme TaxID=42672 RepID=A0A8H5IDX7_9HYPO|nr:C6 transcription factor [Fusarium napiforme]
MDILEKGSLSYVQGLVLTANYLQKPNSGFVLIAIGWSMALVIGLHREFSLPSSSPLMMEIRRSAWWTVCLFGVNVRPPSNLNDQDLAVDMECLPESSDGPSTTACLVQHAKLAQVANMVQVELLAHQIPGHGGAVTLDRIQSELFLSLFETPTDPMADSGLQGSAVGIWELTTQDRASASHKAAAVQNRNTTFLELPFPFYAQSSSDAELLDATGGIMAQYSTQHPTIGTDNIPSDPPRPFFAEECDDLCHIALSARP